MVALLGGLLAGDAAAAGAGGAHGVEVPFAREVFDLEREEAAPEAPVILLGSPAAPGAPPPFAGVPAQGLALAPPRLALLAEPASRAAFIESADPRRGFAWRAALRQSAQFLSIQQGYMLAQNQWYRGEVLRGPWFKEWMESVRGIRGWSDGDPFFDNYIGHPLQGALTGYIQIQNDPRGMRREFGRDREYWKSRLKATAWAAAYSAQFEIGPLSEASIGNLGKHTYRNPHTHRMTTGMGAVDLVVSPAGGLGWMLLEDALDRYVIKRRELRDGRPRNLLRTLLNPTRGAANVLRGKAPWHRDTRLEMELRLAEDSARR